VDEGVSRAEGQQADASVSKADQAAAARLGTIRFRMDIAYDGTDFAGWAMQPGLRSIEDTLMTTLAMILRLPVTPRLVVAGRTDAGVHATGQVVHVDLPDGVIDLGEGVGVGAGAMTPVATLRRINGALGFNSDVVVKTFDVAAPGFDARFSPIARRYEYRIFDRVEFVNPLERHNTVRFHGKLESDAMNAAAGSLVGLRDFGAFCKLRPGATTIRELQVFTWERTDAGALVATLQADAFCHSMVRALIGATVAVGEGRLSPEDLTVVRDEALRTSEFTVMPAHGLTLTEVLYPPDEELGPRAELTRRRRELTDEPDIA
jgi:tRNA pseudouridine38-40 synthase